MPQKQPQQISNKFLITILVGIMTTLFGGTGVMYYLGMFSNVQVVMETSPAYRLAYLLHVGSYHDIEKSIKKAEGELIKAGVDAIIPSALFLDDSGKVTENKRRSKVGFIVKHGDFIPASLQEENLPQRRVVKVTFSGGTLLGSYKAYEAMKGWAKANGYELLLPALEIYHPDGPNEYQLGIRKRP